VDRLAQSEARASEAEKQAQQKEADLRRKLEELAQAEERAVSAVNDDDHFSRMQASVGEPPHLPADSAAAARFSQLDELRCTPLRCIRHESPWALCGSGSCWLASATCTRDDRFPTRYVTTFLPDDLTTALPVAAGLSVAAAVAVGSVALNAKVGGTPLTHPSPNTSMSRASLSAQEPAGYGAEVGQAGAAAAAAAAATRSATRSAAPPPAPPPAGAALRAAERAARSGAARPGGSSVRWQRSAPDILFGSLGNLAKEPLGWFKGASSPLSPMSGNGRGAITRQAASNQFAGGPGFGAESAMPGREKEYAAFKDQASNQYAGGPTYAPPPIDAERRNRSPGISNNFYEVSQADFKRPHGMGAGAAPGAPEAPPAGFSAQAQHEFGAESPMPGREKEYKAFTDQASNQFSGGPAYTPPPVDAERRNRSPGISNNFYEVSQADFKRPHGMGAGAAPGAPEAPPEFGAESPMPGREREYEAFKDQASNTIAGGAASPPPPIDADRKNRSPGISNNFYERSQADFKRPHGT
jgi:hypothetical protein